MARVALGIGTSHLAMFLRDIPDADPAQVASLRSGFETLAAALAAEAIDVLVVISGEHVNKFFLDNLPAFAVGTAASYWGPVDNVPLEKRNIPGHARLAAHLLQYGMSNGIDWARVDEWPLDHGMVVPLHFLDPSARIPVVPIFVNCAAPPGPSLARCQDVGEKLAEALRQWDEDANIACIACGGLSHSPGDPRMGWIDEAFDREFLAMLEGGQSASIAAISEERIWEAGSSTSEIRAWAMLSGIFKNQRMDVITYEPIEAFGTGCAQVVVSSKGSH